MDTKAIELQIKELENKAIQNACRLKKEIGFGIAAAVQRELGKAEGLREALAFLAAKPPAGEFTERLRRNVLDKHCWREFETLLKSDVLEACARLDAAEQEKQREVHQAYLNGRTKGFYDGKRNADDLEAELASARKKNKRVREVLEEAWGPIEELVTQCASDVATACWPSGFGYSEKDVKRINKTIQQTLEK